jgi:hypothetical protein
MRRHALKRYSCFKSRQTSVANKRPQTLVLDRVATGFGEKLTYDYMEEIYENETSRKRAVMCGLDKSGLRYRQLEGCFEHGNVHSNYIIITF